MSEELVQQHLPFMSLYGTHLYPSILLILANHIRMQFGVTDKTTNKKVELEIGAEEGPALVLGCRRGGGSIRRRRQSVFLL